MKDKGQVKTKHDMLRKEIRHQLLWMRKFVSTMQNEADLRELMHKITDLQDMLTPGGNNR